MIHLKGKIICTCIKNNNNSPSFADYLTEEGFSCIEIVTGKIYTIKADNLYEKISGAEWLVFTSKNAVTGFLENSGQVAAGTKVAAVGGSTAKKLEQSGIEVNLLSEIATGEALGKKLRKMCTGKVVYLCAKMTGGSLEKEFEGYGDFVKVPVYENQCTDTFSEYGNAAKSGKFADVSGIAVTSGSSGERIKWLIDILSDIRVFSIGPACTQRLIECGVSEDRIVEAGEHTFKGLCSVIKNL